MVEMVPQVAELSRTRDVSHDGHVLTVWDSYPEGLLSCTGPEALRMCSCLPPTTLVYITARVNTAVKFSLYFLSRCPRSARVYIDPIYAAVGIC